MSYTQTTLSNSQFFRLFVYEARIIPKMGVNYNNQTLYKIKNLITLQKDVTYQENSSIYADKRTIKISGKSRK